MEVRFFLTREDIWHYNIYIYTQQRRWTSLVLLLVYAFFILLTLLVLYFSFSLFNLLPPLILLIAIPLLVISILRRAASQGAGFGGEHVISLIPEGIQERSNQGEGVRNWSAIKTIGQDKYNLYFIVHSSSSRIVLAVVIPRRAFVVPQDAERFLNQAHSYWLSNQQMRPQ